MQEPAPSWRADRPCDEGAVADPVHGAGLTLAQSLRLQFSDPRLRQLFGRYATYVGGSPYLSPAILGLIWHSEARGVWAVEGGMHRLAAAVHRLAEARGARFRFGAKVQHIETQGGRTAASACRWHAAQGRYRPLQR
jgi:1-hydroxycarotenoid 3,4-desaturase